MDSRAASGERSIPAVLKDIGTGIQEIVRSEIKLAKIEVAENVRNARSAAMMLSAGGALGLYAIGFILLAAMFALEIVMPAWLAALIIGVVLLIGAGVGISSGRRRLKAIRPPEKTIQTVKEDLAWMKERAAS